MNSSLPIKAMPRVVLPSNLARYTGGARDVEVAAMNYRDLVTELGQRFSQLSEERIRRHAIAIDGMMVQEPMLETFRADSEVVLVAKIAGG